MFFVLCEALMELPEVFTKLTQQGEGEKEFFWALQIWESGVKSAIWTIEDEKTKVVSVGSFEEWQGTVDDLIVAADKSLGIAVQHFPEKEKEPSKAIFGLPYHWLEEEKIISSWQQMLQTLCEKLELSPLGFVLTIDALNHHLRQTEGVPPSTILVGLQKEQVQVAVLEQGKVQGVEQVRRSENLAADVYEGLLRFEKVEPLPSRMLLYNGEDLEEAKQTLLDFTWEEKLPFLHVPKIEILPIDFDITSVCLAGGSEVAKSLGFKVTGVAQTEEALPEEAETFPAGEASTTEAVIPHKAPDFGFVVGKDIKEEEGEEEEQTGEEVVLEEKEDEKETTGEPAVGELTPVVEEKPEEKKRLAFSLPRLSWPALPLPRLSWLVVVIFGLLFLGGGAFAFLWFIPRAEIILYLTPKPLEKEFPLIVDPNQELVDETNIILPGKIIEKEVEGEQTAVTTGKKTVGEKASGEVTIFNTGPTRLLAAGTVLLGPGGLKFTLDQETMVASGSAVNRVELKTKATASAIGAEYNLAGDSQFTITSLDKSLIGAKNEAAFGGGTSRQIQAVSEEDQKSLLKRLGEELTEGAKTKLLSEIPSDRKLIEESMSTKEVTRSFDQKVGDEAEQLTLSLKIEATALTFAEEEFFSLATGQLSGSLPEGYEPQKEAIKSQFKLEKQEKDGSVLFRVVVAANLLPKINFEEITQNIKGKSPSVAQEYLGKLSGVSRAEIEIKPTLPAPIYFLPRRSERLSFEVRSQ